jgi:hypothetical protein
VHVISTPPSTQVDIIEDMDIIEDIIEDGNEVEEESLADDAHFLGNEDEIRTRQKLNSVATITTLRFQPISSSRFSIPLCRLMAMPMVRPTLTSDLAKLEQEFVHGYREGASVFYVTTTNEEGNSQEVTEADKASWGPIWDAKNDIFNSYLLSDPALAPFTNLMFFVCDGNHRRQAWLNHIERLHRTDEDWHYLVDSILLETKGKNGLVMQVMHNINK